MAGLHFIRDNVIVISDDDSDSDAELVNLTFNIDPGTNNGGQPVVCCEQQDNILDSTQCSVDYLQPSNGSVYEDEIIEIRVNYQYCEESNIVEGATSFQNCDNVEETELAGDIELQMDRSRMIVDSFMCYPEAVDNCDVSYLMELPNRESVNETDKLAYVNEKNGDESIREEFKLTNICVQEFASLRDVRDSQFTDFSAGEEHEQIINKEKQCQCQHCGLACSTNHRPRKELTGDFELEIDRSQVFMCYPEGVDSCDVSYLMDLPNKQCVEEKDELAYANEKNGDESIEGKFKLTNICEQGFASLRDVRDSQFTDFSAGEEHEQIINTEKQCQCQHCGLACSTKHCKEQTEDFELEIDRSQVFMCYPEGVDSCDVSYLMDLPNRQCVEEKDELAYANEKNGDESIEGKFKLTNICEQGFASLCDVQDSQFTDFSAGEKHEQIINKEKQCQCQHCGLACSTNHRPRKEQTEDFELEIDRSQVFMCYPEGVGSCDVSYLMDLPNRQCVEEKDELAYANEKNGDESIEGKFKQTNICGQGFASLCDVQDSQFTDFSAGEKHEQIINKEKQCQCQHCGLACSTNHRPCKELTGDFELEIDRSQVFVDSFMCYPEGVDSCDVSYLMDLPNKQCVEETDELAYVNEKNGDESTGKEFKPTNICGQEFASSCDVRDSQFTDFSAREEHEQIINKKNNCQCQHCGLACSTKHRPCRHNLIHTGEKPYKCDICGKLFKNRRYLPTHKRIHTGEKPYKCDICGKEFKDKSYLPKHKKTHSEEKPYKCDICGLEYADPSVFMQHKSSHLGKKPYKCSMCGLEYSDPTVFKRHKNSHLDEKPFKCDVCAKEFEDSSCLPKHKRIHAGVPFTSDVSGHNFRMKSSLRQRKRANRREKSFKCDICGGAFAQSGHLAIHKRLHTREKLYKCDTCGLNFTHSDSLRQHKRKHTEEKSYKCDVSEQGFRINSTLRPRKGPQTGEKLFKCDVCGKEFYYSRSLSKHKIIHTGEKSYRCDTRGLKNADKCDTRGLKNADRCDTRGLKNTNANTLRRHENSDLDKKPLKCDICGKVFSFERYLTRHKRIHTGEHSLKCSWCGTQCKDYDDLTHHNKMHTSEKCSCDICGKTFSSSKYLLIHKRVHTGETLHKCKICGRNYTDSSGLSLHLKGHAGVENKCDVCGKIFTNRNSLQRHKRIHTGKKPYKCLLCGLQFKDNRGLKRHEQSHRREIRV